MPRTTTRRAGQGPNHRLVRNLQFPIVESLAHVVLEALVAGTHWQFADLDDFGAGALALGPVHVEVGAHQEIGGDRLTGADVCSANTGTYCDRDVTALRGFGEHLINASDQFRYVIHAAQFFAQEHELIAGEPRKRVAGPRDGGQALCH